MGKKKKDRIVSEHMWHHQNPKKAAELSERYGVERPQFDEDHGYDTERFHREVNEAARGDYDQRRSLEAAAMAGDKKAKRMAGQGFSNIEDVYDAHEWSKKNHGGGGKFSSASDFAALTHRMVEQDRDTHNEDIDSRIEDRFKQFKPEKEQEPEPAAPVELSQRAKDAMAFQEYGFNPDNSGESEAIFGSKEQEAQDFADSYKQRVKLQFG